MPRDVRLLPSLRLDHREYGEWRMNGSKKDACVRAGLFFYQRGIMSVVVCLQGLLLPIVCPPPVDSRFRQE